MSRRDGAGATSSRRSRQRQEAGERKLAGWAATLTILCLLLLSPRLVGSLLPCAASLRPELMKRGAALMSTTASSWPSPSRRPRDLTPCPRCGSFGLLPNSTKTCPTCAGSGLVLNASSPPLPPPDLRSRKTQVLIAGCGVAGPALCLGLAQRGVQAVILDKDPSPTSRAQGYGLTLQQGRRALKR